MSMPTINHCQECQSKSLSWQTHNKNVSGVQQGRLNSNDIECQLVLGCDSCSETLAIISADKVAAWLTENGPSTMGRAALARAIREAMEASAVRNDSAELTIFGERLRVRYYGAKWIHERAVEDGWACLDIGEFDEVLTKGLPKKQSTDLAVDQLAKVLDDNQRLTKLLAERSNQLDNALDDIEGLINTVRSYDKDHQVHNEEGTVRRYRAVLAATIGPGQNYVADRSAQESR